jgi:hypothetical protein
MELQPLPLGIDRMARRNASSRNSLGFAPALSIRRSSFHAGSGAVLFFAIRYEKLIATRRITVLS